MANRELRGTFGLKKTDWLSIFLVCSLPILLNAAGLFEWRSTNPVYILSGLAFEYQPPILPGFPWIDPSIGSYSQSLGHLSAEEWLHGRVPWWNHFTGVGMPLAGEMCSESFFLPFVLLYHFPNGWLIHEVVLEILAGLGAYACFRKLGLDSFSSLVGAALFASCGVFAWHGNPVTGPVAFLPWLIFGIESARSSAVNNCKGGWIVIALSLSFSIYGGFPETAYINGLFAGVWSIWRCFPGTTSFRFQFAKKLLTGVIVGVLLSVPILAPFLEFLKLSYVGRHSYDLGFGALPREALSISLFPWLYGGIFAFQDLRGIVFLVWSNVGGYLSIVQVGMILLALFFGRRKPLYILLTGWIAVCFARTFGLPIASPLVDAMPLIKLAAFYRYAPASWEFSSAMICAFLLNEMRSNGLRAKGKIAAGIAIGLVAVIALYPATNLYNELVSKPLYKGFFWISILWGFGLLLAILVLVCLDALRGSKRRNILCGTIGALMIVDSAALFIVPTFSGLVIKDRSIRHQLDFLRENLRLNRFYTLGPVAANYGAYFQLASINHNYIPVSERWRKYVLSHLDPYANAICFVAGCPRQDPGAPTQAEVFRQRIHAYEEVGVRYLLTAHGADLESLNSLDFGSGPAKALMLNTGQSIEGELVDPRLSGIEIRSAFITIGNYQGKSDGNLKVEIAGDQGNATGVADLRNTPDNRALRVDLDRPAKSATGRIHYKLEHREGREPVAIWSATLKPGLTRGSSNATPRGDVPYLTFSDRTSKDQGFWKAYESNAIDVYELDAPKPYFEIIDGAGRIEAKNQFEASVYSPIDSEVVRRELFYPGWKATIDGHEVPIDCYNELFQKIGVPSGTHEIRFFYRPTHFFIMMTCLVSGLVWIAFCLCSQCLGLITNKSFHVRISNSTVVL
jgi:hypothetical protein